MRLPIYQVDAFTDALFRGNPAAVMPLDAWLPDAVMQAIAMENNLSETAFLVPEGDAWRLRWFTPAAEVPLCGHATLASAHVLFERGGVDADEIAFDTASGRLTVGRGATGLVMDFPANPPRVAEAPEGLTRALGGVEPLEVWATPRHWLALYDSAATVRALRPDFRALAGLGKPGVIVTAPGENEAGSDVASRYFAPGHGVDEDPVTGSAHCVIAPFWSARLGRSRLVCDQVSARGGRIVATDLGERILLEGQAVIFLEGMVELPTPG